MVVVVVGCVFCGAFVWYNAWRSLLMVVTCGLGGVVVLIVLLWCIARLCIRCYAVFCFFVIVCLWLMIAFILCLFIVYSLCRFDGWCCCA